MKKLFIISLFFITFSANAQEKECDGFAIKTFLIEAYGNKFIEVNNEFFSVGRRICRFDEVEAVLWEPKRWPTKTVYWLKVLYINGKVLALEGTNETAAINARLAIKCFADKAQRK